MRIMIGAVLGVLMAAQPAMAFQETGVTGGAEAKVEPGVPGAGALESGLGGASEFVKPEDSEDTGTEVRIPGLGRLGVIPKLDFGLELLYGATEGDAPADELLEDDITIRGRLKHKF